MEKKHIGVYGVLQSNDQILLVLKTRGPYKGKWDLPGGGIHHGEGMEEALQRELKEEIGFSPSKEQMRLCETISATIQYQENGESISLHHVGTIYEVSPFKKEAISLSIQEEDVQGAKWMDRSIAAHLLSPFALHAIKKYGTSNV